MTMSDWLSQPENYVFLVIALPMVFGAWRVVTTRNVVHAALYLVLALAGSAALFLLLVNRGAARAATALPMPDPPPTTTTRRS